MKNAYKAEPRPYLGYSDHISVMLIPVYRPLLKLAIPVQKQITVWPDNATSALQDCFQDTDWNMFKKTATYNNHTDLQEYTETVTAYKITSQTAEIHRACGKPFRPSLTTGPTTGLLTCMYIIPQKNNICMFTCSRTKNYLTLVPSQLLD